MMIVRRAFVCRLSCPQPHKDGRYRRRVLLVTSDGADNHDRYSKSDIKRSLKECDYQLYAMGVLEAV
jgi:hypothetical protein